MKIKSPNGSGSAGDGRSFFALFFLTVSFAPFLAPPVFAGNAGSFLRAYPLPVPTKQYQVIETTSPLPAPEGYSISLTAATGKFEPTTFVLRAGEALSGINIQVSALTGPGTIPAGNVDVRLVKTWYQDSSGNCSCDVGKFLIPEILVKDDALINTDRIGQKSYLRATVNGVQQYVDITTVGSAVPAGAIVQDSAALQPFSMAINTNKQVWITTNVPVGAPAGTYTGTITISVPSKPDTTLLISLTVLPFALSQPFAEQAIYYRALLNNSCSTLTPECRTPTQMAAEFANMRDHGIQYPTIYDRVTAPLLATRLSLMDSAGLPKDKIYQAGDNLRVLGVTNQSLIASVVTQWKNFAASRGWGQVYNYGNDEATGATFDSQLTTFDTIHANGGKVFNAIPDATTAVRPGMNKIDLPVLYGYGMPTTTIAQVHQTNGKVSRYGGPFSDFENPEYVRKHYGFGLLYKDYDAAMNYTYQGVGQGIGDAWNDFKSNAAGERNMMWTYPTSNGVVDTLQWEGYREAVDDIRYASTLAARKGWTKAQLVSYLRSLPTLAENADSINAPATRQTIINEFLKHDCSTTSTHRPDGRRAIGFVVQWTPFGCTFLAREPIRKYEIDVLGSLRKHQAAALSHDGERSSQQAFSSTCNI